MKSISTVFEDFNKLKVLVIGDVMIDSYIWGKVERISPEAPVPIINVEKREKRLGGAANVALNLKALGAEPILCALVGNDSDGLEFKHLIQLAGLSSEGVVTSNERMTTIKHRVMSGSHHLLRIDQENTHTVSVSEKKFLLEKIKEILPRVDVVIFEDYDKGVLDSEIIALVVSWAKTQNIPTVVDPKKRNFLYYKGVSLFKPNKKELKEGIKTESPLKTIEEIDTAISQLQTILGADAVMITLSEDGVYYKNGSNGLHVPAHIRNISDVSGAGDTVISVAALCLGLQLPPQIIAELSNLSGGLVCEKVGVVPIDKEELLSEALKLNLTY